MVNAAELLAGTLHAMRYPGHNHIDRRRVGRPCDYFTRPEEFGQSADAEQTCPVGGDELSASIAWIQHRLVLTWRAANSRCDTHSARRFGISSSTWSRSILGQRWLGETVMASIIEQVIQPRTRP